MLLLPGLGNSGGDGERWDEKHRLPERWKPPSQTHWQVVYFRPQTPCESKPNSQHTSNTPSLRVTMWSHLVSGPWGSDVQCRQGIEAPVNVCPGSRPRQPGHPAPSLLCHCPSRQLQLSSVLPRRLSCLCLEPFPGEQPPGHCSLSDPARWQAPYDEGTAPPPQLPMMEKGKIWRISRIF